MIQFNDVASQWKEIEPTTLPKLTEFLRTGPYILGSNVKSFEEDFANYCSSQYAVGISNATDGLKIAIQCALSFRKISRIILPANGYIADILAPLYNHIPQIEFVDCDPYYNMDTDLLREKFKGDTGGTTIILAVHLYGQAANVPEMRKIAKDAFIIEDCAQAHGATIKGKKVGTMGDIGVFSFYPTKNLGAIGDAGLITTDIERIYKDCLALRNYGSEDKTTYIGVGHNNRLDEIQALILKEKLPHLDQWIDKKKNLAYLYKTFLKDVKQINLPLEAPYNDGSTYHIYPIRAEKRDQLRNYLEREKIPTLIHYPKPLHKIFEHRKEGKLISFPKAEQYAQELISLPMHPYLTASDILSITNFIKGFFQNDGL